MTKPTINVDFCDFHANFSKTDNFYYNLLKERFNLLLCDQPDFLIFSSHGYQHRLHTGTRIFVSGESAAPDYRHCEYSLSCLKVTDPRHLQVPFYVTYGRSDPQGAVKKNDDVAAILAGKTKFCSFVVSSKNPPDRIKFFERLSRYKGVDSGGRILNNIGGPIPGFYNGKIDFLRQYKFNIAFENRYLRGYTTEKIFEPMVARCLPIYRGNPLIAEEFNPKSFLNYADFPSEQALVDKIIELDQDDAKYAEYLGQPYFYDDTPNLYFSRERMQDFFEKIFLSPRPATAPARIRKMLFGRWTLVKKNYSR